MTKRSAEEWWAEGVQLFNEEKFFECHEAWEEIWKLSSGEEKKFLQGMIQAAVAILHSMRGNAEGASSLLEKSRVKLEALPDEYRGIELGEFKRELREFFEKKGGVPRVRKASRRKFEQRQRDS